MISKNEGHGPRRTEREGNEWSKRDKDRRRRSRRNRRKIRTEKSNSRSHRPRSRRKRDSERNKSRDWDRRMKRHRRRGGTTVPEEERRAGWAPEGTREDGPRPEEGPAGTKEAEVSGRRVEEDVPA